VCNTRHELFDIHALLSRKHWCIGLLQRHRRSIRNLLQPFRIGMWFFG
jgi:hypothetical protein